MTTPTPEEMVELAHQLDMAAPGERVRFLNRNGYDGELKNCQEHFVEGQELTVSDLSIGGWSSSYQFSEVPRKWFNTVCFEPIRASQENSRG